MKLAESSRRTIEEFFRFYLRDEQFKLPPMSFYAGKFAAPLTSLLHIHGITVGRKIFIAPKLLFINSNADQSLPDDLIVHEIAHVLQYEQEGFFTFLTKYFGEYLRNLKELGKFNAAARGSAYFHISYERQARQAATEFLRWKLEKAVGEPSAFD